MKLSADRISFYTTGFLSVSLFSILLKSVLFSWSMQGRMWGAIDGLNMCINAFCCSSGR